MSTNIASDTSSRYTIFVPLDKPADSTDRQNYVEINAGKPDGDRPFGFAGLSLRSDAHMLVDVHKTLMMQTDGQVCMQTFGSWDQFAKGNMTVATEGAMKLAASSSVLVASGCGQGESYNTPYSMTDPTWIPYNNLKLHYAVDKLSTTLKNLFYGATWETNPDPGDGMLHRVGKMLEDLGHAQVAVANASLFKGLTGGMSWTPGYQSGVFEPGATSEFPFLIAFDPYAPSKRGIGWVTLFAFATQINVSLHRFADALQALVGAITDLEVVRRIRALSNAVKDFSAFLLAVQPEKWRQWGDSDVWRTKYALWHQHFLQTDATGGDAPATLTTSAGETFDLSHAYDSSQSNPVILQFRTYAGQEPQNLYASDLSTAGAAYPYHAVTAAQLKQALAIVSARAVPSNQFTATVTSDSPAKVTATHNTMGSTSYLEFSGAGAKVLFGADPTYNNGKDEKDSHGFFRFNNWMNNVSSLLDGTALAAIARPVFDMVNQVVAVEDKIQAVLKDLNDFIMPQSKKDAVGVFGGAGGVTVATTGTITEVGHSITLIAGGKASDIDTRKMVAWDLGIHKIEELNADFNKWLDKELGTQLFHDKNGNLKAPEPAHFRVISSGSVNLVAKEAIRMCSVEQTMVLADTLEMHAAQTATISAHMQALKLTGKNVAIGDTSAAGAGTSARQPTEAITMNAKDSLRLLTETCGVNVMGKANQIRLGSKSDRLAAISISKPHVEIDGAASKVNAGAQGKAYVTLDCKDKKVDVAADKINLTGQMTFAGKLTVNGSVDIGGVLKIQGVAPPTMAQVTVAVDAAKAELQGKINTLTAKVGALETAKDTLEQTLAQANTAIRALQVDVDWASGMALLGVATAESAKNRAIAAAIAARDAIQVQLNTTIIQITNVRNELLILGAAPDEQ